MFKHKTLEEKDIKNNLEKYSNVELFERREKEITYSTKKIKTTPSLNHHKKIKKKLLSNEELFYPLLQTLSSFKTFDKSILNSETSTLKFMSTTTTNFHKPRKSKPKIESSIPKNKFHIFALTDSNLSNHNKKEKNKIYYRNCSNFEDSKPIKDEKNSIKNLLLCKLDKISGTKICKTSREPELIDFKLKKYIKDSSVKNYIKKCEEYQSLNYTVNTKQERAIRLQETYISELQYFEDTINSLMSSKKLFAFEFSDKIVDYLKYITIRRDEENLKSMKLTQEVIRLKQDIEQINNKKKKIEIEKNNIIRWIYFQIQLKEKKLDLPSYYKSIIELNKPLETKKETKEKDNSSTQQSFPPKKRRMTRRYLLDLFKTDSESSISNNNNNNANNNNNNNSSNNNSNQGYFFSFGRKNKDEYQRIKNYKKELIFKTPEEFQDELINLENQNLDLIKQKDDLNSQVIKLKSYLSKISKQENKLESTINYKIYEKEKELEQIKNIVNAKYKVIAKITEDPEPKVTQRKISMHSIYKKEINKGKKNILYEKINKLYETCRLIEVNKNFNIKMFKKNITKEAEMLRLLKYIEFGIDYLIDKFKSNDKNNYMIQELIKKVTYEIDKQHKNDKTLKQKMQEIEKNRKLYQEIAERNNKIHFLPRKKIDLSRFKIKKVKKAHEIDSNKEPQFEDYITADDEINQGNKDFKKFDNLKSEEEKF